MIYDPNFLYINYLKKYTHFSPKVVLRKHNLFYYETRTVTQRMNESFTVSSHFLINDK